MGEQSGIAQAWKDRFAAEADAEVAEIELPSKLKVKAKQLRFLDMLALGLFPDALTPLVLEWVVGIPQRAGADDAPKQMTESVLRHFEEYVEVRNRVWHACVVDPRFWSTVEEAIEHPDWLPFGKVSAEDRQFVMDWANGVADDLKEWLFRRQRGTAGDGPGEAGTVGERAGLPDLRSGPGDDAGDRPTEGTDPGAADPAGTSDVARRGRGAAGRDRTRTVYPATGEPGDAPSPEVLVGAGASAERGAGRAGRRR